MDRSTSQPRLSSYLLASSLLLGMIFTATRDAAAQAGVRAMRRAH